MIYKIDIHTDRVNYIVHLSEEDELFWIVPQTDDGTDKWTRIQEWLDDGNEVTDDIEYRDMYAGHRRMQFPEIGEQLDKLFHDIENGTLDQNGDFFTALKAVKDANPKPGDN